MLTNPEETAPASMPADVTEAVEFIRSRVRVVPDIALILGSGLGALAEAASDALIIPAEDVPGYPHSSVEGHYGRLVFGRLEGKNVLFVQGRVHYYEGHSIRRVTFPIRLIHALGARNLLVTNAAGGINRDFAPGTLMFITDHINFGFANPLVGPNVDGGPRFPDMSQPYDLEWVARAKQIAEKENVATKEGVYIFTSGPSYETGAEIRFFDRIGADAVGMSTVPEVIQARYFDMRVLGISTITNPAAGLQDEPLSHEEVLDVGGRVRERLERLVRGIVRNLDGEER